MYRVRFDRFGVWCLVFGVWRLTMSPRRADDTSRLISACVDATAVEKGHLDDDRRLPRTMHVGTETGTRPPLSNGLPLAAVARKKYGEVRRQSDQ